MKAFLSFLIYPLGTALVLLVLGLALLVVDRRRLGFGLALAGLGWVWLWSTPVFSDWVRGTLERPWIQFAAEEVPEAEAIVVLGGAFSHSAPWPYPNASSSVDRYWHAARLYRAGKAPLVIVSGGRTSGLGPGLTEAASGRLFLLDMGVPASAIVVEDQALTTRGNAWYVAEMLEQRGIERFLMVTSALHMRRSVLAFEAVGLEPIPVATDFEVRPGPWRFQRLLPSASALAASTRAVHEIVGYWVYSGTR